MKQNDAEQAIRISVREWARERGVKPGDLSASFMDFKDWLSQKGRGSYLDFRARAGADWVAEQWFDEEMKIGWAN